MSDEELIELLRISASAALDFARRYPEVIAEYPDCYELLPYWIAGLVLGRCE